MTTEENSPVLGSIVFGNNYPIPNTNPIPRGIYNAPIVNQGWQCPICKHVYAPNFPSCTNCNKPDMRGSVG